MALQSAAAHSGKQTLLGGDFGDASTSSGGTCMARRCDIPYVAHGWILHWHHVASGLTVPADHARSNLCGVFGGQHYSLMQFMPSHLPLCAIVLTEPCPSTPTTGKSAYVGIRQRRPALDEIWKALCEGSLAASTLSGG